MIHVIHTEKTTSSGRGQRMKALPVGVSLDHEIEWDIPALCLRHLRLSLALSGHLRIGELVAES